MFALSIIICFAVAALSVFVEKLIPGELLGASIIALFMGTIINSFFHPDWIKPALKFTSKRMQKELKAASNGQKVNLVKIIPWFITGFLLMAILNSVGFIPTTIGGAIKGVSKFLMVTALAAIGLGTSLTDFKKAGLRPMFYGITIDTLVTITALIVIWCMGLA